MSIDGLRLTSVVVHDMEGRPAAAVLGSCECGCSTFFTYNLLLDGGRQHPHLQCSSCGASYCDGSCAEAGPEATVPGGSNIDPTDE